MILQLCPSLWILSIFLRFMPSPATGTSWRSIWKLTFRAWNLKRPRFLRRMKFKTLLSRTWNLICTAMTTACPGNMGSICFMKGGMLIDAARTKNSPGGQATPPGFLRAISLQNSQFCRVRMSPQQFAHRPLFLF